jgi:hypothetical protein
MEGAACKRPRTPFQRDFQSLSGGHFLETMWTMLTFKNQNFPSKDKEDP